MRKLLFGGVSAGLLGALLMAGALPAAQPGKAPRTGGIPACEANLTDAIASLRACTTDLGTCQEDLQASEARRGGVPGDGYEDTVEPRGAHGPALAYEDCGDGTIADLSTGLVWEKKAHDGSIHDMDDRYSWSSSGTAADGTAFTVFLATLNDGGGFAGHSDWRLPHVKELQSIIDYSAFVPAIHPGLGPTAPSFYWSATSDAVNPAEAWSVLFKFGSVGFRDKTSDSLVRAVRTGSCPGG